MEVISDSHEFISSTAVIVKPESWKYFDEGAEIQERCRQYVEAIMKLDPFLALNTSKIVEKPTTDISNDVRINPASYSMATSHSCNNHNNRRNAQPAHVAKMRHETYTIGKKNRIELPSDVLGLTVIRPVNELYADPVDYRSYRLITKSPRYTDDITNELNKMTKKTVLQINDRAFSGRDPMLIIAFSQNFEAVCNASNIHDGRAM